MGLRLITWLYRRPRARRAARLTMLLWLASVWTVTCAPVANAAGGGPAVTWTGLRDSYGVPIGAYFVSVVPMAEAVGAQGPDFGVDPATWGPALSASMATVMTHTQLSMWLTLECAALVIVAAAAIWFVKFALSAQWMAWLAALATPLVTNVSVLVDRLYVVPIALLVCCLVGGVIALTSGVGRGAGIILGGFGIVLAIALLLDDPITDLVSDNGVLGVGRSLGFAVAQGAANNGAVAPGSSTAQMELVGAWLCDVLLRQQIQLVNFGMVVDDVPGCAQLWSASVLSGERAGPAHAMAGCAPQAAAYARELDVSSVGLMTVVIVVVSVIATALIYVACEVFRIGFLAFGHLLVLIPAAAVGVAPGPPRRFAARIATRLVVHGVEMLAATAGLGIIVLIMSGVTRGAVPGMIGMTHPVAKLAVLLLIAVVGAFAFRRLLRGFGDSGIPNPLRAAGSAVAQTIPSASAIGRGDRSTPGSRPGSRSDARSPQWDGARRPSSDPRGRRAHPSHQPERKAVGAQHAGPASPTPQPTAARPGAVRHSSTPSGASTAAASTTAASSAASAHPHAAAAMAVSERVRPSAPSRTPSTEQSTPTTSHGAAGRGGPGRSSSATPPTSQRPPTTTPPQNGPRPPVPPPHLLRAKPPGRNASPSTDSEDPDGRSTPPHRSTGADPT